MIYTVSFYSSVGDKNPIINTKLSHWAHLVAFKTADDSVKWLHYNRVGFCLKIWTLPKGDLALSLFSRHWTAPDRSTLRWTLSPNGQIKSKSDGILKINSTVHKSWFSLRLTWSGRRLIYIKPRIWEGFW